MSNPFSFKTHVEIHNDLQSNKTVVTIEALDSANLLSRIAKIFYENKIDVDSARITTLGERVEDNFYVFDRKTESNVFIFTNIRLSFSVKYLSLIHI